LRILTFLFTSLTLFYVQNSAQAEETAKAKESIQARHAIALHGTPKYGPDFQHLDYVNPDAPKGGTLRQHTLGTFDSMNPFIVKGAPAAGLNYMRSGPIYESLMQNSWDEPFTLYGILAQSIEIAPDKSWVRFVLRPEAHWSDNKPITAGDVVWTFNTLMEKGTPFYKAYWGDVMNVEAQDERTVTFSFKRKGNAELPLIIAEMAVMPKHFWEAEGRDFSKTSLEAPMGSGPYKISKIVPGRSIEYVRDPNWWGKDLPFFKGFYNFDRLVFDYYKDSNVAHEAFLSGDFDVKDENTMKLWETAYNIPALQSGKLIKEEIDNARPAGMQAFIYNIRRPIFQDKVVREALAYAFDFDWSNKQFAYRKYVRTNSFFENSELASSALPSKEELKILEPYRDKIPEDLFTKTYKAPVTDGSGNIRRNLKVAADMLDAAGYKLGPDKIRVKQTPEGPMRLEFEILDSNPLFERWVLPFQKNLKRLGVKTTFRVVDTAQYQNRMNEFDFDMTIGSFGQSNSPGNEQREFWGSEKADMPGSRNLIGIKDPVIDDIIEQIIHAKSREDLVIKTHALDRILLWNHYVIPMWHYPKWRIAYWDKLARPQNLSGISPLISYTWWAKENETAQPPQAQ
jgi:microcin C transport system substrate-binding protein